VHVILNDDEVSSDVDEPLQMRLWSSSTVGRLSGPASATSDVTAAVKAVADKEAVDMRATEEVVVKEAVDKEATDKRTVEVCLIFLYSAFFPPHSKVQF
jgi:uncharacterized protein involved in propanediol utilization